MSRPGDAAKPPASAKRRTGRFRLVLISCLLTGLFLCAPDGQRTCHELGAYLWPPTRCQVVAASAGITGQWEMPYTFLVKYRYPQPPIVGRPAFESQLVALSYRGGKDYADVQRLLLQFPAGAPAICYVNPRNPQEAVLVRRMPWSHLMGVVVFTTLFLGCGSLFLALWRIEEERESLHNLPLSVQARWPQSEGVEYARIARWLAIALVGGLGLLGSLAAFGGVCLPVIVQTIAARSWPQVPCRIIYSRLQEPRERDGTPPRVDILYEYRMGAQVLRSNSYCLLGMHFESAHTKLMAVASHPPGAERVCRVNPRDPTQAVLAGSPTGEFVFILLVLAGIAVSAYALRKLLQWDPEKSARDAAGSVFSLGERVSARGVPATPLAGSLVLRPNDSPVAVFIVGSLIAMLFSGSAAVAVWHVIRWFHHGQPAWAAAASLLFLVPFGLLFLAIAVAGLLMTFNPGPELRLASGLVRLGQTIRCQWRLVGNTSRLRRLTIAVLARECVIHTVRPATKPDKKTVGMGPPSEVFLERVLADITDPQMMRVGHFELTIPAGSMHSLVGINNRIVWLFHIHGEMVRRPDVRAEIEFMVLPQESGSAAGN